MSKAYVFTQLGGRETQKLIDRPVPQPGPGELAVKVRAAGVNPGNWKTRSGRYGTDNPLRLPMGQELSGVITAIGADASGFTVGEAILGPAAPGHGAFAEHTVMLAADAVAIPKEISFTDAATIPVAAATAYDATYQIELEPRQKALFLGGGVGLMAAQIGRVHEFTVIGIASESKRKVVASTGATDIPSGDRVAARIRHESPDGVDLILDLVGGDALREVDDLVTGPGKIISAADPTTAIELGGTALQRRSHRRRKNRPRHRQDRPGNAPRIHLVTRRTVVRRSTNDDNRKDGTMSTKFVQEKVADLTPVVDADDPREAIEVGVLMANGKLVGRNFANRAEATAWARPEYGDQVVEFNALCQCDFTS